MVTSCAQLNSQQIKEEIRSFALSLGFSKCGFATADIVPDTLNSIYQRWIDENMNGDMDYMNRYPDIRRNPKLLMDGASSIITVALNYYPSRIQGEEIPQIAYYAYGEDYHDVVRKKLRLLGDYLAENFNVTSRVCVDTAPIMERYWAKQSGLGFIGVNRLLILPDMGSYFFLGELIIDMPLPPDEPEVRNCDNCNLCVEACPTGAISRDRGVDARRCLSAMTIEYRGDDIPESVASAMGNRVYGCDTCQRVCPHNRDAKPTRVDEFAPSDILLSLTKARIETLTEDEFRTIFAKSAIKRLKLPRLQRNLRYLK